MTVSPALEVRPDEAFPVNRGQMCIKGFTSADLLDHPERVTTPLLRGRRRAPRAGQLGGGARLRRRAAAGDPRRARPRGAGGVRQRRAHQREGLPARQVRAPRAAHAEHRLQRPLLHGLGGGRPEPGLRHRSRAAVSGQRHRARPKTLLLWGSNVAETMPPIMQWVSAQRAEGHAHRRRSAPHGDRARGRRCTCSSRRGPTSRWPTGSCTWRSRTASSTRPTSRRATVGFEAARAGGAGGPPGARRARDRGIRSTSSGARSTCWPRRESAMLLSGRGPEQQSKGVDTVVAFTNLMLALGKVGKPSSGYGCLTGQGNGQGRARARAEGRPAPRLSADRKPRRPRGGGARLGRRPGRAARQGEERLRAARRARPRGRHPRAAGVRVERGGRLAERAPHRKAAGVARSAGGLRRVRQRDRARRARRSCRSPSGRRRTAR